MSEKVLRYDTAHDVRMRLHGCICMYENKPVWVLHDGEDNLEVFLRDVRTGKDMLRIHSSDPKLDISSVPLGYTMTTKKTPAPTFYFRQPYRQQKQGVSSDNVSYLVDYWGGTNSGRGFSIDGHLLADLIEGKYPPVNQVEKIISANNSCVIARHYCIVRNSKISAPDLLKSRGQTVGFYDNQANVAYVLPPFTTGYHMMSLRKLGIHTEFIGLSQD